MTDGWVGEATEPTSGCFDAAGNVVAWGRDGTVGRLRRQYPAEIYGLLAEERGRLRARFWNPDGSQEPFCGNGLRCVPVWLGAPIGAAVPVETAIGRVLTRVEAEGQSQVEIPRSAVTMARLDDGDFLVNVGTPHRVRLVDNIDDPEWVDRGHLLSRGPDAVNATFVAVAEAGLLIRTLERGVAHETRSCGTAAVAAFVVLEGQVGSACEARFWSGERLRVAIGAGGDSIVLRGACRRIG